MSSVRPAQLARFTSAPPQEFSLRMVYPDNRDTNRRSAGGAKLLTLPHQVAYHPVYLLYHGLC